MLTTHTKTPHHTTNHPPTHTNTTPHHYTHTHHTTHTQSHTTEATTRRHTSQNMTIHYCPQNRGSAITDYLVVTTMVTEVSTNGPSTHPLSHCVPAPLASPLLELSQNHVTNHHSHSHLVKSSRPHPLPLLQWVSALWPPHSLDCHKMFTNRSHLAKSSRLLPLTSDLPAPWSVTKQCSPIIIHIWQRVLGSPPHFWPPCSLKCHKTMFTNHHSYFAVSSRLLPLTSDLPAPWSVTKQCSPIIIHILQRVPGSSPSPLTSQLPGVSQNNVHQSSFIFCREFQAPSPHLWPPCSLECHKTMFTNHHSYFAESSRLLPLTSDLPAPWTVTRQKKQ